MNNAALIIIDAQQEYFAPIGKVVLPGARPARDGQVDPHDQVHRTHLGSLSGFLAEIQRTDDLTAGG